MPEANADFTSVYRSFTMFSNMMRSLPLRLDGFPWARLAPSLSLNDFNLQCSEKDPLAIFALRFQWTVAIPLSRRGILSRNSKSWRQPSRTLLPSPRRPHDDRFAPRPSRSAPLGPAGAAAGTGRRRAGAARRAAANQPDPRRLDRQDPFRRRSPRALARRRTRRPKNRLHDLPQNGPQKPASRKCRTARIVTRSRSIL